jgi:hypothetical protein
MPNQTLPTIADVERIATLPEAVLRNLQITQCYHELGVALVERTGGYANWCCFATWASKQAGQTIRKEDLGRALEAALGSEASALEAAQALKTAAANLGAQLKIQELLKLIWRTYNPQAAFERSSTAVARGNLKVFEEIGREFARFHAQCLPDLTYNAENITHFIEQLRPGDPPEGQQYLRQAFLHYYQALFTSNEKACNELLLLANLEIGFHEQTRLQPEINEALVAPIISPQEFANNLLKALRPEGGWVAKVSLFILRLFGRLANFDAAIKSYVAGAQRQTQALITETMMTIELPRNHRLRLGDDLAARYPAAFEHLANPDLLGLLAQIDPTPDSLVESGAVYWGDLPDRMHFIADMFRCFQMSPELLEAPFDSAQTLALKENRLPTGRL